MFNSLFNMQKCSNIELFFGTKIYTEKSLKKFQKASKFFLFILLLSKKILSKKAILNFAICRVHTRLIREQFLWHSREIRCHHFTLERLPRLQLLDHRLLVINIGTNLRLVKHHHFSSFYACSCFLIRIFTLWRLIFCGRLFIRCRFQRFLVLEKPVEQEVFVARYFQQSFLILAEIFLEKFVFLEDFFFGREKFEILTDFWIFLQNS